MIFSKHYSKLDRDVFTTIRRNTGYYRPAQIIFCQVKGERQEIKASILSVVPIKKSEITDALAQADADCSRTELLAMLTDWYGSACDDYVLIRLRKESSAGRY